MIKFIHLSDSHLGESMPLYHTPPNNWRGEGFLRNYNTALKPALKGEVDFVLHSGDLFDKHHINLDIIGRAMVPLRKIASKRIPIFIVPGNHEREHIPGGLLLAGENIHIFSKPETIEIVVKEKKIVIAGFPFISRDSRTLFKKTLKNTGWEHKKDTFNILLCHQTFEGAKVGMKNFTFRNGENIVPLMEVPSGFDYVACGHIHKQQIIKGKEAKIYYPGSTERVSFQEINETKGYYIVSLKDSIPDTRFYKVPATTMTIVEFETTDKTVNEIINVIVGKIRSAKPFSIVRFYLKGEIEREYLKNIPLYLYKKMRNDIKVEFRKEKLVILREKKKDFYPRLTQREPETFVAYSPPLKRERKEFPFTKKEMENIPNRPGVYLLMNTNGMVLYIGKTKDLRKRLLSHITNKEKDKPGFYFWLKQVKKFDFVETGDEFSALFLEMNLIRINMPPYNRQIKEFQNYVYLVLKKNMYFPIIMVVDEMKNDGNLYFGPFRREYKIRENIRFIREIFGIRPCRRNLNDNLRLFSCPLEGMGRCDAPCTGGVSPSDYQRRVERMVKFLYGYDNNVVRNLERKREKLIKLLEFERASSLQKNIVDLTVIFNTLRNIRKATELKGTLSLNFGGREKKTFDVINGRILYQNGIRKNPVFPPQKWELDGMMLLLRAIKSRAKCFSFS